VASHLLPQSGMTRFFLLAFVVLVACSEDTGVRAINIHTGETGTFGSTSQVPDGWTVCPPNADCPQPVQCADLGEKDCLVRSDCEAVYEPCSTGEKFVECKPKAPPPGVCADEGESCTNTKCCDGLYCCSGVPVPAGAEYCTPGACPISDRNRKHAIVPVNPDEVLARLSKLPVATWTYNFEGDGVRHMGPMAQDFASAFGLGSTDRRIFTIDADGVALASIQALVHRFEGLQGANLALERENAKLRDLLGTLEKRTARLERTLR
jgi:hypothetical protein